MKPRSQSGVALVITLLMLSVITFLTVAFLAVSRRDRAAVSTSLTQRDARNMADAGLQRAEADIVTRMLSATNDWGMPETLNYDLMVSRNYINPNGFDRNDAIPFDTNNVSYVDVNGNPVTNPDDLAMVIGNLFFDPRPPVFVRTNLDPKTPLDFRFWVDLNRNGRFETNGRTPEVGVDGKVIQPNNVTNYVNYVGEPEWIGVLFNPEYPHSVSNEFIGRYAYLVAPIGKTLDWNYIHNFSKLSGLGTTEFQRNQGFGSWEINLAGLLANVNPNIWNTNRTLGPLTIQPYNYNASATANSGLAFVDARSILANRYGGPNKFNLAFANTMLGPANNFANDYIDDYAGGPLQMTAARTNEQDKLLAPWPGSDNPISYYDPQEVSDPTKAVPDFANHLLSAGTNLDTYNRYTFSRLLASIGTGSEPEMQVDILAGPHSVYGTNTILRNNSRTWDRRVKVNLNYDNTQQITNGANIVQTNYKSWTPLGFFTNAADLILRSQFADDTNFTITNLWIYSANTNNSAIRYSAKLHRCLQLAANLYDASNNGNTNFPSVFRPIFRETGDANTTNHNIYIVGYEEVVGGSDALKVVQYPFYSFTNKISGYTNFNIWGVPFVIGAKKGLPNFNECDFANDISFSRKLQFKKDSHGAPPSETNQMYILALTNYTGIELWNSYRTNWGRAITIISTNQMQAALSVSYTKGTRRAPIYYGYTNGIFSQNVTSNNLAALNVLRGFTNSGTASNTFWIPLQTNALVMPFSRYDEGSHSWVTITNTDIDGDSMLFPGAGELPCYNFDLKLTNRLFYAMIDQESGRLLDFVNLGDFGTEVDLMQSARQQLVDKGVPANSGSPNPWMTNSDGALPGISNQIAVAMGKAYFPNNSIWQPRITGNGSSGQSTSQSDDFRNWWYNTDGTETNLYMACPYQAQTYQSQEDSCLHFSWSFEANDPLVHYTREDLTNPQKAGGYGNTITDVGSMGVINTRAMSWRGSLQNPGAAGGVTVNNMTFTDPNLNVSDDWDFPTNKYPNVGWIGRVHRGTPWQTIFLKADSDSHGSQNMTNWITQWVGTSDTYPTNDWALPDLFTVAANDNAARGVLSVNNTNVAAWSAVLSGVIALRNATNSFVIAPTNVPDLIDGIVGSDLVNPTNSVNGVRGRKTGRIFHKTGEILEAASLTTKAPFMYSVSDTNVTDEAVERIPQQILSLLKVGEPRFVIWAYGQSLKPQGGKYLGSLSDYYNMYTNYQITGESLTRTVCRVENINFTNLVPRVVVESFNVVPGDQ